MHRTHILFQTANIGRGVMGDEGTSHQVSGVIKSWRGEICSVRTTCAVSGPLHGWQNEHYT